MTLKKESIYSLVPVVESNIDNVSHPPPDASGDCSNVMKKKKKISLSSYKTKYHPQVKEEYFRKYKDPLNQHKTIGLEKIEVPSTRKYLKKQEARERFLPDIKKERQYKNQIKNIKENSLKFGQYNYKPHLLRKNFENFIAKNAVEAICTRTKPNTRNIVDHYKGSKYSLDPPKTNPGLEKKFVYKPGYGEVPPYVARRLRGLQRTLEALKSFYQQKDNVGKNVLVKGSQRKEILDGLKRAWDIANKEYLCLSLSSDTLRHLKQKIALETELKDLENDIKFLEKYQYVIVK